MSLPGGAKTTSSIAPEEAVRTGRQEPLAPETIQRPDGAAVGPLGGGLALPPAQNSHSNPKMGSIPHWYDVSIWPLTPFHVYAAMFFRL